MADLYTSNLTDLNVINKALKRPSAYLGPIATRCTFMESTSTSLKQCMSVSPHLNVGDDVDYLVLVYLNMVATGGAETAAGFPINVTCSVENLSSGGGVRNQGLFFSSVDALGMGVGTGTVQGTIADKSFGFAVVPVSVKTGEECLVRSYQSNAGGILYSNRAGARDKMTYGASGIADQTMSGDVIAGAGTNVFKPYFILGITTRPTVFLPGDSNGFGYGTPNSGNEWWGIVGDIARVVGMNLGYIHGGIPSATLLNDNVPANYVLRQFASQFCSHIIRQTGINDVAGAPDAATLAARCTTFAAKFPGKPVIGCTLGPSNQSSDGWTTLANQTQSNAAFEARRVAFNNLERAGIAGEMGCLDIADALESDRDSGKWAVGYLPGATSGIALTGDGLHRFDAGEKRIRRLLTPRPSELIWR